MSSVPDLSEWFDIDTQIIISSVSLVVASIWVLYFGSVSTDTGRIIPFGTVLVGVGMLAIHSLLMNYMMYYPDHPYKNVLLMLSPVWLLVVCLAIYLIQA
jgi:hypothetical protein